MKQTFADAMPRVPRFREINLPEKGGRNWLSRWSSMKFPRGLLFVRGDAAGYYGNGRETHTRSQTVTRLLKALMGIIKVFYVSFVRGYREKLFVGG